MRESNIQICEGPGCKAWSSDRIASEFRAVLEGRDLEEINVCRVPCMNKCGGGVSVRVNSKHQIMKFKELDDLLTIFSIPEEIITNTCTP